MSIDFLPNNSPDAKPNKEEQRRINNFMGQARE